MAWLRKYELSTFTERSFKLLKHATRVKPGISLTTTTPRPSILPPALFMPFKNPDDAIRSILKDFPPRPLEQASFNVLVSKAVSETPSNRSSDIRKSQWEYAVKNELFELAVRVF